MKTPVFYLCRHCHNLIYMLEDAGVRPVCCGQKMEELIPNVTDAAEEKHVPVVTAQGREVSVNVGSARHPMTSEHLIQWVCLQSAQGIQFKRLAPDSLPEAVFLLSDGDSAEAVYAYCNIHGLWKTEPA